MNSARLTCRILFVSLFAVTTVRAGDAPACWNVDDLRAGMKGHGVTVMKGITLEKFDAVVLGVLKNTSPGRDLVLCRLSGLDLERTGVIAGMSGSPVYIDGKLVGAVAYAWAYGKDPIAGITPFSQMLAFGEAAERRAESERKPIRVGLGQPVHIDGKNCDSITVSQAPPSATGESDGVWLTPLQAPVAASGFTAHSLKLLRDQFPTSGLVPVQGGAVPARVAADAKKLARLEPGAALSVALITGDFDMSGIGTVTHVDGKRVWGWGHPFMSLGGCDLPMMTGWVHTVYPRLTVSFKMGSPLQAVGVVNTDVSTGIAGWLDRTPDMLPVTMIVRREPGGQSHVFKVQVARQKQLLPGLVFASLTNSIDMEGELPEEMTVAFTCRISIEGEKPIVVQDTFSGVSFSGGRAPANLYTPVAQLVSQLANHPFKPLRITNIECETDVFPGRRTADLESIELDADAVSPGETIRGTAFIRPYKGMLTRVPFQFAVPGDLPDGSYTMFIGDGVAAARADLRGRPHLANPQDAGQMMDAIRIIAAGRRTDLTVRLALPTGGVAIDGKPLPDLPGSVSQILSQTRRTPAQAITTTLIKTHPTTWVIVGTDTARINVTRAKRSALTKE